MALSNVNRFWLTPIVYSTFSLDNTLSIVLPNIFLVIILFDTSIVSLKETSVKKVTPDPSINSSITLNEASVPLPPPPPPQLDEIDTPFTVKPPVIASVPLISVFVSMSNFLSLVDAVKSVMFIVPPAFALPSLA